RSGGLSLSIVVDGDTAPPRRAQISTTVQPDSSIWTALFSKSTLVRTLDPGSNGPNQRVSSYPANEMMKNISNGYSKLGPGSPYQPASNQNMIDAFPAMKRASVARTTSERVRLFDFMREIENAPETDLAQMHRDVSERLLDHDPGLSFSDKLSI